MPFKPFALAALVTLLPALASAGGEWIHVRIQEDGSDDVSVNVPVSLLAVAADLLPEDVYDRGEIVLHDRRYDHRELAAVWKEIKAAPDSEFVTVRTSEESVVCRKEGRFLIVRTEEHGRHGSTIDVKIPTAVVDALLSGPEDRLDFEAAVRALAAHGPGQLVTIRDGDDTAIDVWIDHRREAR